jgi:hypothetical protein
MKNEIILDIPDLFHDSKPNTKNLRIIKTARSERKINEAARKGYKPLIKKVPQSPEIQSKFAIWQNQKTGEIELAVDYRAEYSFKDDMVKVIDWTFYYPKPFKTPFAAYLIPSDIAVGERVFLEDLIEDIVGQSWNQGDTYRLESAEAIWTGNDFEIQATKKDARYLIG